MRALLPALAVGLVLLPTAASAEVSIDTVVPQGDGTASVVVAVDGPCSTTGLELSLPDGSAVLRVVERDGWSHTLDDRTVGLTGPAIPADELAEFILIARIGADPEPIGVVQTCADGETVGTGLPLPADDEIVDPTLAVHAPPESGASATEVAIAVALFTGLATLVGAWLSRRARRQPPIRGTIGG